jgi:hypothetical protein
MALYFTGGGYYAKVAAPYRCIDVCHFSMSPWTDELTPTQDGVSFKLGEWLNLWTAMRDIHVHADLDSEWSVL